MRRWVSLAAGVLLLGLLPATAPAAEGDGAEEAARAAQASHRVARNFEVVGRNSLLNRGMNSALAIHRHWVYVGSRTDGTHVNAGILVLDIADPKNPVVVNRITGPTQARPGQTSRELRVWPE